MIARLGNKAARKQYYEQINSTNSSKSSTNSQLRNKRQKIVTPDPSVRSSVSSFDRYKKNMKERLVLMEKEVSLMEMMKLSEEEIRTVRVKMLTLIRKMRSVLDPNEPSENRRVITLMTIETEDDYDVVQYFDSTSSISRKV